MVYHSFFQGLICPSFHPPHLPLPGRNLLSFPPPPAPPVLLPRPLPLPPPLLPPPLHPMSSRRPLYLSTRRHICVHGLKGVTNGQSCRIPLPLSTLPAKLPLLSNTWFRLPTLLHFHLSLPSPIPPPLHPPLLARSACTYSSQRLGLRCATWASGGTCWVTWLKGGQRAVKMETDCMRERERGRKRDRGKVANPIGCPDCWIARQLTKGQGSCRCAHKS